MSSLKLQIFFYFAMTISGCSSERLFNNSKSTEATHQMKCIDGSTRQGFIFPTTSGEAPCVQGTQTCLDGTWQGPKLFQTCENFTKSCGGQAHGTVISGFLQPTSPLGTPCSPATKTCVNGTWSGPEVFPSCTEL